MDDLAKEAEDELRRAGGLGQPQRPMSPTRSMPPMRRQAPPPPAEDLYGPEDVDDDEDESWTPEEEALAVTNFAVQQLAERDYRPPSQYRGSPASSLMGSSPEEMRNQAMAQLLERQRRLAQENPVPARPSRVVESPTVGARARAAPILTAAPMINLPRAAGMPRDSGARASTIASPTDAAPAPRGRQGGNFARRVDAAKHRAEEGGLPTPPAAPAEEAGATMVTTRRGVTRRSTPRNVPTANGLRTDSGETDDWATAPVGGGGAVAGESADPRGALTGASHATLSAIAVLLASMEVLPAPMTGDRDQSRLYEEVTQHMTRLSVLLERYLGALPPEWPEG